LTDLFDGGAFYRAGCGGRATGRDRGRVAAFVLDSPSSRRRYADGVDTNRSLRKHLVDLLTGENAHVSLDSAVEGLPEGARGKRPPGAEHSPWELLEHLRIAQWDIVEFSRNAKHVSPKWPAGYWPESQEPPSDHAWDKSIEGFRADLEAMVELIENESTDLFAKIPHGSGQTILREALLVADHNAYHVGQLVTVRRLLGVWK
jgi:hypothetical protein